VSVAGPIRRVPVPDLCALWAETGAAPMNIALLGVLDQGSGDESVEPTEVLARVRVAVEANLPRTPMLRRILQKTRVGEGTPVWIDAPALDITEHVVLARPDRELSGEESFHAWCARRSALPLPRSRPLWRMDVIPGLSGGRVGVLVVLHHVVADGLRGVELVGALLDPGPRPRPGPVGAWRYEPPPSRGELVRDNLSGRFAAVSRFRLGRVLRTLHVLRTLAREPGGRAPATFLGGPIRPGRQLLVLRFPLDGLRATAHRQGCTINELLLAGVTAGLRDVLLERGECANGLVLRASVPVGALAGREGGMLMAPLPVGVADAAERLRIIIGAVRPRKERADQGVAGVVTMPASLARLGVLWARHAASRHINLYVTNVPGPAEPLYLGGARLLEGAGVAPLVAGVRLSVTALSYDGRFAVALLADDALDGLPVLAAGVRSTLSGLAGP
jgi:WS/DGAT/MGAT family acyltransferase